eukprot:gnl/Dysnectes_brevis/2117_a2459_1947.p1 GENE.gnl/Dysnectes_brevis/2117_a2459_1947~~gnl/Dysnectes_brevis/2117_a2459_1947.p1  ORF type:complete len:217 (-),score=80.36 gnl/Dysnectes_brevis/2117_a2459_1947:37-687(-)
MNSLEEGPVIFLVRPSLSSAKRISLLLDAVNEHQQAILSFHLVAVPAVGPMAEEVLKEEGTWPLLTIHTWEMSWVFLDSDLLSLEQPEAWHQMAIGGDLSAVDQLARSICVLQRHFGRIPSIRYKGKFSERVAGLLLSLTAEDADIDDSTPTAIDQLIIMDRGADPLTPLLTPVTYYGVLADNFHVEQGSLRRSGITPLPRFAPSAAIPDPPPTGD